jgi:hypothetical protein
MDALFHLKHHVNDAVHALTRPTHRLMHDAMLQSGRMVAWARTRPCVIVLARYQRGWCSNESVSLCKVCSDRHLHFGLLERRKEAKHTPRRVVTAVTLVWC